MIKNPSARTTFGSSATGSCIALTLTIGLLVGCDPAKDAPTGPLPTAGGQPQTGLRTTKMRIGNHDFTIEIADDDASRETGMMYRDNLPDDRGMIFVFYVEQPLGFWMKNTRVPLDIIYLDAAGRVVSTATMKPFDLTTTPSRGPAKFAIELNAGKVKQLGVKPGDQILLPTVTR